MRALARAAVLAVALVAALPAASAEGAWPLGSQSVAYSISGLIGGQKKRLDLHHIPRREVVDHDGTIAQHVRVSLLDGRVLSVASPTLAVGAGWHHPEREYTRDTSGRAHFNLHASTTLQGLARFLEVGDPDAGWREVSHETLRNLTMKRLSRARKAGDVVELRAALEHARPYAFDTDATWDRFEDAEM